MTTRHSAYLIVLEEDIREDDAESLIQMLYWIKGIIDVKPVDTSPLDISIAKSRLKHELWKTQQEFFRK